MQYLTAVKLQCKRVYPRFLNGYIKDATRELPGVLPEASIPNHLQQNTLIRRANKMNKNDNNMRKYKINVGAKHLRTQMMETLRLADEGNLCKAMDLLNEAEYTLNEVKKERSLLSESCDNMKDQDDAVGFSQILKETVELACALKARGNGAIQFHIYS